MRELPNCDYDKLNISVGHLLHRNFMTIIKVILFYFFVCN